MKKNILNDKVIRAMAIGISAMLATATPMTTLAAEGDGVDEDGKNVGQESKQDSEAKKAGKAAADSVDTANTSVDTVKNDVKENVTEGEIKVDEDKDAKGVVNDMASSVANAGTDVTNANDQVDVAEDKAGLSDTEYGKAQSKAEEASKIASETKDAMEEANAKVDEQAQKIENAATAADANAAYDELAATADQAQKDFDAKLADYNTAKAAYDEAAAKVAEYEKAYNDAIENAANNAAAAQAELEAAQKNAAELGNAVAAAKKAVDASAAGVIAQMEDLTRKDGGLNWRNEDKLFIAIMEKYYLPQNGIQNAKVTRIQGKDNNEYNYFKAVYYDADGKEQVKYYNFKMDGKSEDDIVIFEKREVEIFGDPNETPDQYVKDKGKGEVEAAVVQAGLENGTVVDANGKYYEYESKTDNTLVSNSEITGTSKEDVTVDEDSKQESWSYDAETGKLVKTVTADVTTVTYTDAKFTTDESYATDADRDNAANAKKVELENATGKDAKITETENTTYTYTASGTYIPTFTKTVKVNKEYESGYLWWEADSEKEAEEKAYDWAKDKIDDDLGDYYLIGNIKSDLSVSMTEEETEEYKIFGKTLTKVTDDSDYLVTGTVTATYAKVTKQTVSQSTFGAIWDDIKSLFGNKSTNEKLEEAARKAVEADGGIFISANWADLQFNKATIQYVAGVKVKTDEKQIEQDAKNAVESTALAQANKNGATGVYNVKTTGTAKLSHTTYSYTVDYLKQQDTNTTKNTTVATETYGNAVGLTGQIIQNKNYIGGNILLTQKDDDYRKFVDDAKAITSKYDRLLIEAEKANADVQTAQKMVVSLKKQIEDLKGKKTNTAALKDLEEKLVVAEANKKGAQDKLDEINQKLKDAGVTRDEVVNRLTPSTPAGGNGGNPSGTTVTETSSAVTIAEGTGITPTVATTTTGTGMATQRRVAAGRTVVAAADQDEVTIDDEETPLVDNAGESSKEETTTISDEDTPLAAEAGAMEEEVHQEKMSWWWLLIVAVLGATGYEMYRKHQEKKKAAVETKNEK